MRGVLGAFYVVHFAHLGIVVPFLGPWLEGRGLDAMGIGALTAMLALFNVLAPWSWGRWADESGRRPLLALIAAASAGLALLAAVATRSVWPLVGCVALYGFSRSALLPYVEATSLEQATLRGFAYGPVRLWGSLSFMFAAAIFGLLEQRLSIDGGMAIAGATLFLVALLAALFPRPWSGALESHPDQAAPRFAGVALVRVFVGCALMQASHAAYYAFYSIRLERLGHDSGTIGGLWAFAVICEVGLLLVVDRVVRRLGHVRVMQVSLLLAALRWAIVAEASSIALLGAAQALHAVTYAAFHVASIRLIFDAFGESRARGQTMFSGMTYGLGMLVGGLVAGALAEPLGLDGLFRLSALIAVAGCLALVGLGRR